ncbi:MAG: hypothetical protein LBC59_03630 [Chitinispirillales bacterium]|jgi:hypothetical protein|nr:hypothetical protein [Chitinispirillales bacterium]
MKGRFLAVASLSVLLAAGGAFAQQNKGGKLVVVQGSSSVDGKTNVTEKLLEECIVALPSFKELEADVTARTEVLKAINGEEGKNDQMKVYTATVRVSYKVRQKILIIITQNTLDASAPVTREEERIVMRETPPFESDPGEGNVFAGRSNRKYYYTSPEAAADNAKKRAQIWVGQQQNVLCSVGK